jgi:hypothetical protein
LTSLADKWSNLTYFTTTTEKVLGGIHAGLTLPTASTDEKKRKMKRNRERGRWRKTDGNIDFKSRNA